MDTNDTHAARKRHPRRASRGSGRPPRREPRGGPSRSPRQAPTSGLQAQILDAARRQAGAAAPRPAIGPHLLDDLARIGERRSEKSIERMGTVMTGDLDRLSRFGRHPYRRGKGGNNPQLVREDGAKAWRCDVESDRPQALRLHWWVTTEGRIEFVSVTPHDAPRPFG